LADLDAIYDYIGRTRRSPDRADQVLDRIHESCQLHAGQPGVGERRPDLGPELLVFSVSPHVVIYRPIEDGVRVLRVFDGRRDYPALFRRGL
jgi:plasmid stabilization system protein ParE